MPQKRLFNRITTHQHNSQRRSVGIITSDSGIVLTNCQNATIRRRTKALCVPAPYLLWKKATSEGEKGERDETKKKKHNLNNVGNGAHKQSVHCCQSGPCLRSCNSIHVMRKVGHVCVPWRTPYGSEWEITVPSSSIRRTDCVCIFFTCLVFVLSGVRW